MTPEQLPQDLRDGIEYRVAKLKESSRAALRGALGAGVYMDFSTKSAVHIARDEMIAEHQLYLAAMLGSPLYEHQRARMLEVLMEIEVLRGVE